MPVAMCGAWVTPTSIVAVMRLPCCAPPALPSRQTEPGGRKPSTLTSESPRPTKRPPAHHWGPPSCCWASVPPEKLRALSRDHRPDVHPRISCRRIRPEHLPHGHRRLQRVRCVPGSQETTDRIAGRISMGGGGEDERQ